MFGSNTIPPTNYYLASSQVEKPTNEQEDLLDNISVTLKLTSQLSNSHIDIGVIC